MQKAKGPGDIPEWPSYIASMTPFQRGQLAQKLGVTERTAFSWAKGATVPSEAMQERITKIIKRGKK